MAQQHRTRFAGLVDILGDINRGWDRVHGVTPQRTRTKATADATAAGRSRRGSTQG